MKSNAKIFKCRRCGFEYVDWMPSVSPYCRRDVCLGDVVHRYVIAQLAVPDGTLLVWGQEEEVT